MATRAGIKDVRAFDNGPPYDPTIQADEVQNWQTRQRMATPGVMVPLSEATDAASNSFANQARLLADYTPYAFTSLLTAAGMLLIPRNTNRTDWAVINNSASTIFVSLGAIVHGDNAGFPVPAGEYFQQSNGVTAVNDIYISTGGAASFAALVLGYEGVPVIGTS